MIPPYENDEQRTKDYEAYVKGLDRTNKTATVTLGTRTLTLVLNVVCSITGFAWIFDAPVHHIDRWFFSAAVATALAHLSLIDGELSLIGARNSTIERLLCMLVKSRPREKDRNAP